MKKRVLSFIMACLVVVSTFIVSKTLVHVHAVDGDSSESAEPSVYGEWVFSGDETDYKKDNNFAVNVYNFGTAVSSLPVTTLIPTTTPEELTKTDGWKYKPVGGYTSAGVYDATRANRCHIAYKGTNSLGGISVDIAPVDYQISIEFTAPSDGIYSFEEVVKQLENTNPRLGNDRSYDAIFAFFVAKGETIYDSYITKPDSSEENPSIGNLTGYVTLKAGEVIRFVAAEAFNNIDAYDAQQNSSSEIYNLSIESLVVKKVADLSPKTDLTETVYRPAFDGTDFTDTTGNFTMKHTKAYNVENGLYYRGSIGANHLTKTEGTTDFSITSWGMTFFKQANGVLSYQNGKCHDGAAENIYGGAIEFVAPEDGTYMLNTFIVKTNMKAVDETITYAIVRSTSDTRYNGKAPLDYVNYSGVYTGAKKDGSIDTLYGLKVPLSATATLKKGEAIAVVIIPDTNNTNKESFIYNLNVVKVTEPGHPGKDHTDEGTWTDNGDGTHSFNYECCDHADVAGVPHSIVDGVCVCGKECEHVWNDGVCTSCSKVCVHDVYENGACKTCGKACAHVWENAVCTICTMGCPDHNVANADGKCAECGLIHTHDWSNENGTCADANCGFACPEHSMNNVNGKCAKCGESHEHVWNDGVCETCTYEHAHTIATLTNNDGTHKLYCSGCGKVYNANEACSPAEPDESNECQCGYDCTADIAEDNFGEVFNSVFTEGATTEHVAVGPQNNALDAFEAIEGAGAAGVTYKGFNLEMVSANSKIVKLRHHILLEGDVENYTVKVNGVAVEDLVYVSDDYYYFEIEVAVGSFDDAYVVTVNDAEVVTASVYSYMKTALASGELSAEQTNLLNALYDWDLAVASAN